ncbi:MAG: lipopolysaccharide biosynthesis protein [Saprospiraceae bacterium]
MSGSLKDKSVSAFLWVIIDKLGSSSINFIITLILARLLSPEDFGVIAMVMVFFELSSSFVDSGFSNALVREKEISEADKSTTFVFNFITALVVYGILFVCAPAIAGFFKEPSLVPITRIMGLNLIINSFSIIQQAVLTQQIDFKTQTKVRIPSVLISGGVAVVLAFAGFGVWSLVIQLVLRAALDSILLWYFHPWKLSLKFYKASFLRLFKFGSNILLAGLVQRFFQHIFKIIIGKYFALATLGFYDQANRFCNMAINHLFQAAQKISYPILSKLQDDFVRLKEGYRKFIKLTSFAIFPSMVLLGVLAEPIIFTLIGEKWAASVPFLKLLCIAGVTYHFHVINQNILLVLGRSDLGLMIEILEKISITIAIIIGVQFGITGLVIGQVISAYVNLIFTTYYSKKYLNYPFFEQIKDILPTIVISLIMGLVLHFAYQFMVPNFLTLFLLGTIGGVIYLGLHYLWKTDEYLMLEKIILPRTKKLAAKLF